MISVPVPLDKLRALLDAHHADDLLREREIREAYRRGYIDGATDPDTLRVTWQTAWAVAQDRLAAALQNDPDLGPGLSERIAARRTAVEEWVRTGKHFPGWTP